MNELTARGTSRSLTVQRDLEADACHFIATAQAALAPRTREAYAYQWGRFVAWCRGHQLPFLPTRPEIVAMYFGHLARPQTFSDTLGRTRERIGCTQSTFSVTRAAIRYMHETLPPNDSGRDLNLATQEIKRFFQGNRRAAHDAGRTINKAAPFTVADWLTLRDIIGEDLRDQRDLALLGLGIVRALRGPSELLALDLGRRGFGWRARRNSFAQVGGRHPHAYDEDGSDGRKGGGPADRRGRCSRSAAGMD